MKKTTLTFPSYDSMWLFKSCTKAINVRIEPKKHLICGLFDTDEIEMAVTKFKATQLQTELLQHAPADEKLPV